MSRNLPLAIFKMPGKNKIHIVFQREANPIIIAKNEEFGGKRGFVFAPFSIDENFPWFLIKPDFEFVNDRIDFEVFNQISKTKTCVYPKKSAIKTKPDFENEVKKIKAAIQQNRLKKVIAWRVKDITKPKHFSLAGFFLSLCETYQSAFVSLVFLPETGLWLGASPELLLKISAQNLQTVALAGTQAFKNKKLESVVWDKKEIEEQDLVTKFLLKKLRELSLKKIETRGPHTVKAGNLLHLKTSFSGSLEEQFDLAKILGAIHPTPAVGGLPKLEALKFIEENETQNREYYSGYLGPVGLLNTTEIYVNLRCMKVLERTLELFVGCGITAGSDPTSEWKETCLKAQTILNVLEKNRDL